VTLSRSLSCAICDQILEELLRGEVQRRPKCPPVHKREHLLLIHLEVEIGLTSPLVEILQNL